MHQHPGLFGDLSVYENIFRLVCAMAAVVIPVAVINPRMIGGGNLTAIAMDAALLMIVMAGQIEGVRTAI